MCDQEVRRWTFPVDTESDCRVTRSVQSTNSGEPPTDLSTVGLYRPPFVFTYSMMGSLL